MTRTEVEKARSLEPVVLRSGGRLRLRALALLEGAMKARQVTKSELAVRLGVRRSAVGHVLKGSGNLTLQTLAEYLGVLEYEIEIIAVERGEVALSMRERRAPDVARLTMRDGDWTAVGHIAIAESNNRRNTPSLRPTVKAVVTAAAWGGGPSELSARNAVEIRSTK